MQADAADHFLQHEAIVPFRRRLAFVWGCLRVHPSSLAFGIIGFTLPELGASAETPVWVTLSLFAMNHFIEMHHPGQHGPQAACGHLGRWNSAIPPALAEH